MSKSPSVQANWKIRFEDEALLKKDGFPDLLIKKDTMTTVLVTYNNNNQQPRRKRRGTVLNVSHCVFYKVVAVGFNTLCYDAERCRGRRVLNPPHE